MIKRFFLVSVLLLLLAPFMLLNVNAKTFDSKTQVNEPEPGLYVLKIDTNKYIVRPFIIENGFDISENVYNKNSNFYAVMNGGYFDFKNRKTVSFVVKDEKTVLDPTKNENLAQNEGLRLNVDLIYNRGELRRMDCSGEVRYEILKHYDTVKNGCKIVDSLQGGPILYPELKVVEEFFIKRNSEGKLTRDAIQVYQKKPRTAVAIKDNNVYFIIASKEHPMSLEALADFIKSQGFEKALNLDGGGSTSLTTETINIKSERNDTQRPVKSFLVIEDRK